MNNNEKTMVFVSVNDEPEDEVQAATRAMQVLTGERDGQPTRMFRLDAVDGDDVQVGNSPLAGSVPSPSSPNSSTADHPLESFEDGFFPLS